jgi:hypothetical protein
MSVDGNGSRPPSRSEFMRHGHAAGREPRLDRHRFTPPELGKSPKMAFHRIDSPCQAIT